MPEITVTDYDGLEIDAESRAITVTLHDGQPARGVPAGGTTNQVLAKASDADYDVAWVNDGVGGGGSLVTVDADGTVTVDGSDVELATDAQLAAHEADTTGVHGIADTSALVVTTDPRLSDVRTPTTHTHDDRYYTETEVDTALAGKAAAADLTAHAGNTSNPHGVTKAQVGLANVDNTSDASKPISTATQTALDAKANAADLTAHLNDTADAHDASAISFAPTGTIAATDVQAAIAEVAAESGGGGSSSQWELSVDLPLTTMTGWTLSSGAWSADANGIRQTQTTAAHKKLHLDTALPLADILAQVEVRANSITSAPAGGRGGIITGSHITSDADQGIDVSLNSAASTTTGFANVHTDDFLANWVDFALSSAVPVGTFATLRVHVRDKALNIWVNGTFLGSVKGESTSFTRAGRFALYAYAADVTFRNLKIWTPTYPA